MNKNNENPKSVTAEQAKGTDAADKQDETIKQSVKKETPDETSDDASGNIDQNGSDTKSTEAEPKQSTGKSAHDDSLLAEVMDKKEKLRKAQAEANELREKLRGYGDIDPKKVQELIKREKEAAQKAAESRGDFEQAKKMMAEEHQAVSAKLNAEIEALKEQLANSHKTIDDLTLGSSFANSNYIKDNLILTPTKARALYGSYFEIKDGSIVAYNKPAGSPDRAPLVDANGDPFNFETAFRKIIEADPDRDTLVRSKVKEGAGSRTDNLASNNKSNTAQLHGVKLIRHALDSGK